MIEEQIFLLRYGEHGFCRKAKELLRQGNIFNVLLCGWRAKILLSCMPLLMHMQETLPDSEERILITMPVFKIVTCFLRLVLLAPFMTIFWLAITNKKKMCLHTKEEDIIEVTFVDAVLSCLSCPPVRK